MADKIYLIYVTSEGTYEDYRESIEIDEFETAGAAVDKAIEKGLMITDSLGIWEDNENAALILRGVLGKSVINFYEPEPEAKPQPEQKGKVTKK